MKLTSNKINGPRAHKIALGLLGALMLVATAGSAVAAPRHDDRDWQRHEVHARTYWHGPHYVREEPRHVIYAPPVVYAPPQPVYQSPGINLILPLNFR